MQDSRSIEKLSDTEYKISINVIAENVDKKFDEFFETIKGQVEVPGFRKGKAPIKRLKQIFNDKAKSSVTVMIIEEQYTKVLEENEINPVTNPKPLDEDEKKEYPGKFGFDNSYSVDLMVEVLPKFIPVGYKDMELSETNINHNDIFQQKMLKYREEFAERKQVLDRGAELGDALVVDFIGRLDTVAFEGGRAESHSIEKLGSGSLIPGFEDQLVGIKTGEKRDIAVTFPIEYNAKHLAGKEAIFEVTAQSIVESKLAEIDEDLALMAGHENVDQLNQAVHEFASHEERLQNRANMDHEIVSKLIEVNKFDIPKSMVEGEKLRLLGKVSIGSLPAEAKSELDKMADYNIRKAILMDQIYESEEEVEVTPDELSQMLEDQAGKSGQTKDEVVSNLYNSNQMDNFIGVLRFAKVIDFIMDNSKQESEKDNGDS